MSLNLEKQLTFVSRKSRVLQKHHTGPTNISWYGAYHHNSVNIFIHMTCVPLILFSGFELASNLGPFFDLPLWLTIPYLEPNLGTFAALAWGGLYVLLEPVAGTALAVICLGAAAGVNYLRESHPGMANQVAIVVHVVSWILQFIGHGKFEGRAPALLDNLFQAVFLAPLFVWLELLFMLGYRSELKARVDQAVAVAIAKWKSEKAAENAKAQ